MVDFTVNSNSDIYYTGKYWNDYPAVTEHLFRRISGDPTIGYLEHFKRSRQEKFGRALILNCGNGWVEREMYGLGLIREAIGIEYSASLVDEARTTAEQAGMPATYTQMDTNSADFRFGDFDLVVNHAAAHHIAYLDRVFRELCRLLPEHGWFFCQDYVGPHRNQYSCEAWEAAWQVNNRLPPHLRQELAYPHLPTMLASDPTEAIHSELILEVFQRYFRMDEYAPLGGAVAYPILTHNDRMWNAPEEERSVWVSQIIDADERFLESHPDSSLFAYFTGTPKKEVLDDHDRLEAWTREEENREELARQQGGEYYPRSALAALAIASSDAALAAEHRGTTIGELLNRVDELQQELQAIKQGTAYRLAVAASRGLPGKVYRGTGRLASRRSTRYGR